MTANQVNQAIYDLHQGLEELQKLATVLMTKTVMVPGVGSLAVPPAKLEEVKGQYNQALVRLRSLLNSVVKAEELSA